MGSGVCGGTAYDFDFDTETAPALTVGAEPYAVQRVTDGLDAHETARWVFFRAADAQDAQPETDYPFVLRYYAQGENGADEECFVGEIGTAVSNFAPVQLSYTVRLRDPVTKNDTTSAITFGVYDRDGSSTASPGLFTNRSATLYPVDTNGREGEALAFPRPSVSYTVPGKGGSSGGGGGGGGSSSGGTVKLNTKDHYSYIIGYTDGTLRPNGSITRAEVATVFFRLLTDETRAQYWATSCDYTDVEPGAWYCNAVSTLTRLGVVNGYPDGSFRPDAGVTRAEFAKIAVSFFDYATADYRAAFPDVDRLAWYAPFVEEADARGLIEGYTDGTFRPERAITRAEACTIVNRTLGRTPSAEKMRISGLIRWPDCGADDWFYEAMMEATNSHDYTRAASDSAETWTKKLAQRSWSALEKIWSEANSAPGGAVGQ